MKKLISPSIFSMILLTLGFVTIINSTAPGCYAATTAPDVCAVCYDDATHYCANCAKKVVCDTCRQEIRKAAKDVISSPHELGLEIEGVHLPGPEFRVQDKCPLCRTPFSDSGSVSGGAAPSTDGEAIRHDTQRYLSNDEIAQQRIEDLARQLKYEVIRNITNQLEIVKANMRSIVSSIGIYPEEIINEFSEEELLRILDRQTPHLDPTIQEIISDLNIQYQQLKEALDQIGLPVGAAYGGGGGGSGADLAE